MRLTSDQQQAIQTAAEDAFGEGVAVWLFGSRVDDLKKGGDIDLLVRPVKGSADQPFARKIRMLTALERRLGERKIDVVVETADDKRPIVAIAHATGARLI
jgi:predicted nucleotidyltransferase